MKERRCGSGNGQACLKVTGMCIHFTSGPPTRSRGMLTNWVSPSCGKWPWLSIGSISINSVLGKFRPMTRIRPKHLGPWQANGENLLTLWPAGGDLMEAKEGTMQVSDRRDFPVPEAVSAKRWNLAVLDYATCPAPRRCQVHNKWQVLNKCFLNEKQCPFINIHLDHDK